MNAYEHFVAGDAVPLRPNRPLRMIGRFLLWLGRWKVAGQLPNVPKMVIVGAPHTSYWDALWTISVLYAVELDAHWMAKKEAFAGPWGGFLRRLGGLPVDRDSPKGLVEQIVDEFNRRDQLALVITPEGTRKQVDKWKTGFYRIAVGAGTPIVLGFLDFKTREIGVASTLYPSGDMEADIEQMKAFYRTITAKHPDLGVS
jgi:1-acyl-sn-glycerol-3-phosphate acyltransferase